MIYIILCIFFNVLIFIIFKLFTKYKIDTFQAIVFNYVVAFFVAFQQNGMHFEIYEIPNKPWFLGVLILGFLFITLFNVVAKTAQKMGVSVVAVASKMSVIIPILFGVFIYKESIGTVKVIGILLALIAVYLATVKENTILNKKFIYLPIILFLGSGVLDTLLKYVEINYVPKNEIHLYSGSIFLVAGILGFLVLFVQLLKKQTKFLLKNVIAGFVLGIPNFFSIFFLLKALKVESFESSTVFTINNVGIVLFSTIIGLLFFQEKLSKLNYLGILFSVIAILMITLTI